MSNPISPVLFMDYGAAGAAAYTGPGDIVSGAFGWWGTRAYSNASIGTNAIRLRATDATEQDFVTVAGGGLDLASINTFKTAHGPGLWVVKLYDQSGNSRDLSQALTAAQFTFTLGGLGSLPVMGFSGNLSETTAANVTFAQPFSWSYVVNYSVGGQSILSVISTDNTQAGHGLASNQEYIYAGTGVASASATDATWLAVNTLFTSGASAIMVNGTDTTGLNPGTTGSSGTAPQSYGASGASNVATSTTEFGLWTSPGFDATKRANINANQRAYYGF